MINNAKETGLAEAQRLITGDRNKSYDHPAIDAKNEYAAGKYVKIPS